MAAAITIDSSGKVAMDSGCGDVQLRRNGWRDGKAIAMGNEMVAAGWLTQWAVDNRQWIRV
jgi:hypothetical protein